MYVFADIGDNSVVDLITVLLLMAIWGGAILTIDYWVWADHLWPSVLVPKGKLGGDSLGIWAMQRHRAARQLVSRQGAPKGLRPVIRSSCGSGFVTQWRVLPCKQDDARPPG
jgi:hypothetical protein